MNPCVLAYCPPPGIRGAKSFLHNMSAWRTRYPLVIFSDHDYGQAVVRIRSSPEFIREQAKYPNGQPNKWAINNLVFLTGLRIILDRGFTHFLYAEADCRVNDHEWDGVVFDEFERRNPEAIVAGTIAGYNVCNKNIGFSRAWNEFIQAQKGSSFPVTSYGGNGSAESHEPAVFPNGALGIYDVEWLKKQYGTLKTVRTAAEMTAFDYDIGRRLVREFGLDVFSYILHMESVYSSYGDVQTTEAERRDMLTTRKVMAVHQIKSEWLGPTPELMEEIGIVEPATPIPTGAYNPIGSVETAVLSSKVDIFIVSYAPDIPYLTYNLRSIQKFCTGFAGVTVLAPKIHAKQFEPIQKEFGFTLKEYSAPRDKKLWHIAHQLQKMYADEWCPKADFILHTDSDCIFTQPTSPGDFFRDGKPILCIEPFEKLPSNPWKPVVQAALKSDCAFETMRRHGAIHPKGLYRLARRFIEDAQAVTEIDDWWMKQKAEYPWGVTEFNFLGSVAILKGLPYHMVDLSKEPETPNHIFQFWSHLPPAQLQEFPSGGKGVPMDKIRELGLD